MPSGCAVCRNLGDEYADATERLAAVVSRQKLCALRHRFEDIEDHARQLADEDGKRSHIRQRIREHIAEDHAA